MMTLKQICDSVSRLARFDTESSYINSTDPDHNYMPELANDIVQELLTEDWEGLKRTGTIVIQSGKYVYDLPSDYSHMSPDTLMNDNIYRQITFPVTELEWRKLQSYNYEISYYGRIIANQDDYSLQIEFDKSIPVGYVINYSYRSNKPIKSKDGLKFLQRFESDGDVWLLDDQLLIKLLHANWIQSMGFEGWQLAAQKAGQYKKKLMSNQVVSRTMQTYGDNELPPEVLGY